MGFGHYTAYTKNFVTQEWFFCNDTKVAKVQASKVKDNPNAYLLFYRKK